MDVKTVALAGGLFAIFTFIHFFVDWILQTHAEAMAKHNNWKVRARHCIIYTVGFIPILYVLHFPLVYFAISINVLFWSHFYLDTYHLVFLWAKYVRKPPEMTDPHKELIMGVDGHQCFKLSPPDARKGFIEFVQTTLGKILMISVDQISHLCFLWVLVYFAMNK